MRQFLTSLQQIAHSDSVSTAHGVYRHLQWQMRRLLNDFPCDLPIAQSKLRVERPGGVAALVNAMGTYDFNNMNLVKALLRRSRGTFFDVGANIGAYTLIASEVEEARIVSIEPHPGTFATLAENVRLNRRYNVTCLNVALSREEGELSLTDETEPELNHIVRSPDGVRAVRVPSRRFDSVCQALQVTPDIVKIDVEGHQQEVLEGFGEYRDAAKIILIEDGDEQRTRKLLRDAGYSGPFFVHFKRQILSEQRQARPEDPVFVHPDLLGECCGGGVSDGAVDLSRLLKWTSLDEPRGAVACR